jgi:hypothetical protein
MQEELLVSCSKQQQCHAARSSIFVMQQAALMPCSKQHWCHAVSSIGGLHNFQVHRSNTWFVAKSGGLQLGANHMPLKLLIFMNSRKLRS